jgi:hypothetical protein
MTWMSRLMYASNFQKQRSASGYRWPEAYRNIRNAEVAFWVDQLYEFHGAALWQFDVRHRPRLLSGWRLLQTVVKPMDYSVQHINLVVVAPFPFVVRFALILRVFHWLSQTPQADEDFVR